MMRYQLGDALCGIGQFRSGATRFPPAKTRWTHASRNTQRLIKLARQDHHDHRDGRVDRRFGIWGIADIFQGFGQSSLATVGSTEISTEQFRQIYNDRLQQIGRQFGRALTTRSGQGLRPRSPGVAAGDRGSCAR